MHLNTQFHSNNSPEPGPGPSAFQVLSDVSSQPSCGVGAVGIPVVQIWKLAPRGSVICPSNGVMCWGWDSHQPHTSTKIHHRRKIKGFMSNPFCAFTLIFTTIP